MPDVSVLLAELLPDRLPLSGSPGRQGELLPVHHRPREERGKERGEERGKERGKGEKQTKSHTAAIPGVFQNVLVPEFR